MDKLKFQKLTKSHWPKVAEIYGQGLATGNATFQTEVPTWEDWDGNHLSDCRFIATLDNEMVGWAALSPVSSRCVYGGVAEVSVYVATHFAGQQIGSKLLKRLITASETKGIWTLQAGIFPENIASLKIHKKLGFREIGFREKIGKMKGVWRDTILLEHRSSKVGII